MWCSKDLLLHCLDAILLFAVFLLQSIVLTQYTLYEHDQDLESDSTLIIQKILWLVADLASVAILLVAVYFGFQNIQQRNRVGIPNGTVNSSVINPSNSFCGYIASTKIPLCYISWLLYSVLLVVKIAVSFKPDVGIPANESSLFGPQVLQLAIGLSAIIFSLLVEAHHDAGHRDPKRNRYLSTVSYEVALEILDTVDFLSFLMPSFENGQAEHEAYPSALFASLIISLAAVNLILPSLTLYKLASTDFGEMYHVRLELAYKTLHLVCVNVPFLVIRVYLWNTGDREDVLFCIKNMYGIIGYFRGACSDIRLLRSGENPNRNRNSRSPPGENKNAIELQNLTT